MTDVPYLLSSFAARGIAFHVDGGALRFRGPAGALTDADKAVLQAAKPQMIAYLSARAAAQRLPIERHADEDHPASLIQRIWLRLMAEPHAPGLEKLPVVLAYRGLDAARAADAVRGLFRRHDSLRSRFDAADGGLTVRHFAPEALDAPIVTAVDAEEAARRIAEIVDPPMPLFGSPLVRTAVIDRADGVVEIVFLAHHIVCDGASLALILSDLTAALTGGEAQAGAVSYADYARWEDVHARSPAGRTLAEYLRARFDDIPLLRSPSGAALTWVPGRKVTRPLELAPRTAGGLAAAASRLRTTPFGAILTAYVLALSRWSGQARFAVRSVGDQRTSDRSLSGVIGMMTVTDIMDIHVPPGASLQEIAARASAQSESAMAMRLAAQAGSKGFEDYRERCGATINYFPYIPPEAPPPGLEPAAAPRLAEAAEHRLATWPEPVPVSPVFLRLIETEHGLTGKFEFNAPLVSPAEQDGLMAAVVEALDEVASA